MNEFRIIGTEKRMSLRNIFEEHKLLLAVNNIRNPYKKLKYPCKDTITKMRYLASLNIKNNKDANKLEKSIRGKNGGFNINEKRISILPLSEFLTGRDNYESFIEFYGDFKECVEYAKSVRAKIEKGQYKSLGEDDEYFVVVGGNTRISQLLLDVFSGEISNLDGELPFAVLSLDEYCEDCFPGVTKISKNSSKEEIREWMAERQIAYEFLMLKDNTAFGGRQNWPEKIFRDNVCKIVSRYVNRSYSDECSMEEFIRSQGGLWDDTGLNFDRVFNLMLLSTFEEHKEELQSMQESDSALSRTSYFDDKNIKFSRKVIEFLRRLNNYNPEKLDRDEIWKQRCGFFKSIGIDLYRLKIEDIDRLNLFLNQLAEAVIEFNKKCFMTKSQELVRPIWQCYKDFDKEFIKFLCEELMEAIDDIAGKNLSKKEKAEGVETLQKALDSLQASFQSLNNVCKDLRTEKKALEKKLAAKDAALEQAKTECKRLKAELARYEKKYGRKAGDE